MISIKSHLQGLINEGSKARLDHMITAARISPSGTKKPQKQNVQHEGVFGEAVSCFKDFLLSISDTEAIRMFYLIKVY